jgi:hypothetical protein
MNKHKLARKLDRYGFLLTVREHKLVSLIHKYDEVDETIGRQVGINPREAEQMCNIALGKFFRLMHNYQQCMPAIDEYINGLNKERVDGSQYSRES